MTWTKKETLYLIFFFILTMIFVKATFFMIEVNIKCADGTEIEIFNYSEDKDYEELCINHTSSSIKLSSGEPVYPRALNTTTYTININ